MLHAMQQFGLPSETFIRDAIIELEALGWTPWVIAQALAPAREEFSGERLLLTPSRLPLADRIAVRSPLAATRDRARRRSARAYLAAIRMAPRGILHAHFGWTGADCALAARKLRLPLVVSFHGTDLTVSAGDRAWGRAYARLLRQAACVTVVSRFLERRLRQTGYDGPVELIPAGVRTGAFPFSGGPRPGRAPRILFVGRLIECKGVDTLIEALARVRASGLQATLRIVGDGPLRAQLEAASRGAGLDGAVRFAGERAHAEVRRELEAADIVVLPSRAMRNGQAEGSPVVAKEAQAVGVPVVATNVGGIPETLPPELAPELVAPDRPELLASQIGRIWEQREHWPVRVRRQREWVVAQFAWESIARQLSAIYERLLAGERP